MKKTFPPERLRGSRAGIVPIVILGILLFLSVSNFRLFNDKNQGGNPTVIIQSDTNKPLKSHDVFNDYTPNLVVPPYIYYPPTPDNPLLYTNVNISNNTSPQNEPSIKISHKNPNRVVSGWRDFRIGYTPTAIRRVGYSYSTDGGTTWAASMLLDSTLLGNGLLRNSDASVTVDTAGNFYITTIALDNSNNNTRLAIYKSTDGGMTFPTAQSLAQGSSEDKEMVTTDLSPNSPYRNNIYITWSRLNLSSDIYLLKSTNAGVSWQTPVAVSTASTYGQGSDPAVGPNGEIYVIWVNANTWGTQYFNKSTNGGVSFGTPTAIATGAPANIPWSQSGPTTFPAVACDISGGARNGYVYVTWCDGRNGDADVFMMRSTDQGSTWSSVIRVNNDNIGNGKVQAWPWIAVNNTGLISIVFYDTRNTPNNNTIEAWLARSSDGGATFTNEVLSSAQSPTNRPNTDVRFGDYIAVDFWGNRVTTAWTDERAGGYDMDIYTAVYDITTGITPVANSIPSKYELKQNYPNPFNPSTLISFNIPRTSDISLTVYDIKGQLVSNVFKGLMNAGEHSITWDGSKLSSGVYFYRLTTDGFTETKKMMMIK